VLFPLLECTDRATGIGLPGRLPHIHQRYMSHLESNSMRRVDQLIVACIL
jgi:hypothetical protein